jgi:hypothetical protein
MSSAQPFQESAAGAGIDDWCNGWWRRIAFDSSHATT